MGEVAKLVFSKGFQTGSNVVLRGKCVTTCLQMVSKVVLCDRHDTFARFSKDDLHFSWLAQHFERVHLYSAWQAQHFRRGVLRVFGELQCQGCVKW